MKNSNDTIGNRTHNIPTCSAVPLGRVVGYKLERMFQEEVRRRGENAQITQSGQL
jgi:hypothetical protein